MIYAGTSWWNKAGPEAVAKLGAVCVCIRHRGGFPRPPPVWVLVAASAVALRLGRGNALSAAALAAAGLLWLALARGAASYDDMLADVALALRWTLVHRTELSVPRCAPPARLVFGGYSSGAHVAATLLQRPAALAAHGLPPPQSLCDGVLLLSGVLGVRSSCVQREAPPLSPRLTDAIVALVFGRAAVAAAAVPSPVHTAELAPALPHPLVGCEHEVFGLPLVEAAMRVLFCSREFARRLAARGVRCRLVEVRSDHWSVLGSRALSDALAFELRTMFLPSASSGSK